MALTRKMLKAMGIDEEKIDQIIEAHTETVDAIKADRDTYKADADKLGGVQKELDDLKANGGEWQTKYEKEHSDFEAYKSAQTAKETKQVKEKAFVAFAQECGISEKRAYAILKVENLDDYELDNDGKVKEPDKHKQHLHTEYPEFVETTTRRGAHVATPPVNNGGHTGKTKEEIMAIRDPAVRQAEIAKNPEAFGLKFN